MELYSITYLAPSSKASQECSIRIEHLDAIIARIRHVNVAFVINRHAPKIQTHLKITISLKIYHSSIPWEFELAGIGTLGPERGQDLAVDVEDLDAVVVGVGHDDAILVAHCDVMGMFQVAGFAPHDPKLANECTIRLENL